MESLSRGMRGESWVEHTYRPGTVITDIRSLGYVRENNDCPLHTGEPDETREAKCTRVGLCVC